MRYSNKKFAVLVFIALILFLIFPKPALAIYVSFETNPLVWLYNMLIASQSSVTAGATTAQTAQTYLEWAFKLLKEALKRQLLNMIVDRIVEWIQGRGEPKFITDWPGFFRDAVDQAGGKFIKQIGLSQLCSVFGLRLSGAFIPIPQFTTRTSCTMRQAGVNIDAFLQNFNTQNGGWTAWQEMVLRPQNNIYGAYVLAWDQYEIEKSAAAKAAAAEAQAGKGFLSVKRCLETDQAALGSCLNDCGSLTTCAATCQQTSCKKWETVTPGAVVGDLAAKAVGSDIDYIVNAEDFAAYVSAITNAILTRMFTEGVGLLHVSSSSGGGGGGGGSSAQTQCAPLLGTAAYNSCISSIQTGTGIIDTQKNYLIGLIDQDLVYQDQLLGTKTATWITLNNSVDILNLLKNCQGTTPPALAQVQGAASTTASQIIQIQSDIIALRGKRQEIVAVTDISQIPPLWAQVASVVNPALTYSLVLAARDETIRKQRDLDTIYQPQLTSCLTAAVGGGGGGGGQ